jgi:hypothetical protein
VSVNCTYILVYKYDKRSGYSTCANSAYLMNAKNLTPGSTEIVRADAYVPNGVASGQLTLATLTIQVSSA